MTSGTVITIITLFITLATVAVLVSQRANTAQVLQAAGSAVGGAIGAAVSPVTGGGNNSSS